MNDAAFKGTGWSFPPRFGRGGASVATVSGDEDILESLQILLGTAPGERVMRPSFGCNLDAYVFAEMDQATVNSISRTVNDAILYNEPRIDVDEIDISRDPDDDGTLLIRITWRSRLTNARYNMVYPFYVDEASTTPLPEGR